jgi:hypothetical protein
VENIVLSIVYMNRLVAIDPRAFALHKAWISRRDDRLPLNAKRDREQAVAAANIATRYLKKSFDSPDLSALPNALRELAPTLIDADASASHTPGW